MQKLWWVVGIVVIAGLVWWATKTPDAASTSIRVGVIGSLSGNAAYYGEQNKRGVEVAKEELLTKYPNLTLEVFHQDSLFTPKGGVDAYNTLKALGGVDALVTHSSPVSIAVQPLAKADGVLQVAASASAGGYSSPNDLSYRTSPLGALEAGPMAEYIHEKGYKKLAILYFQNEVGKSMADALVAALSENSPETDVVLNDGYLVETSDFRTHITKIKEAQADAVYVLGLATGIANFLNQSKEQNLTVPFLGFRSSEDPLLIKNAGQNAEGFVYTYAFDPMGSGLVEQFSKSYQSKYGELPDGYAAEGYLGMMLAAEAFAKCKKDTACISDHFATFNEDTIFGPITFDANGDPTYAFFLKTVKDGKFVPVE